MNCNSFVPLAFMIVLYTQSLNALPKLPQTAADDELISSNDQILSKSKTIDQVVQQKKSGAFLTNGYQTLLAGQLIVDQLSSLIDGLGRSEWVQSILRVFSRSATTVDLQEHPGEKRRRTEKDTSRQRPQNRQFDDPITSLSSLDISPSIDSSPDRVEKEEPSPSFNIAAEWKKALFGRGGILTEIFHVVNDKRKEGLANAAKTAATQSDLPNNNIADFSKIIEALFKKSQSGNFDEPLPEIPFIGICNRLNCGDVYKAIDEFRKSELFTNFQTALSLMHDPKGWDVIGELLANPELIENFTGTESIQELFSVRSKGDNGGDGKAAKSGRIGEKDSDIGVDFTSMIDGPESTANKEMPEIAASIDSPDYYSFVEKGEGDPDHTVEKVVKSSGRERQITTTKVLKITATTTPKPLTKSTTVFVMAKTIKTAEKFDLIPLPEIAESIDGLPEEFESIVLEKTERIGEMKPQLQKTVNPNQNITEKWVTPKRVGYVVQTRKNTEADLSQSSSSRKSNTNNKSISTTTRQLRTTDATTLAARRGKPSTTRLTQRVTDTTTLAAGLRSTTTKRTTTRRPTTTTMESAVVTAKPKKNFRISDDYYSMYYDN